MKKTKKLAALFLALVMVLSCMAMTAAAYGEEEHNHECTECFADASVARFPTMPCPSCGRGMTHVRTYTTSEGTFTDVECRPCGETATLKW